MMYQKQKNESSAHYFKYRVFFNSLAFSQISDQKFVPINGKNIAFKTFGVNNRRDGELVVVFESGLGSGGGSFASLVSLIQKVFLE